VTCGSRRLLELIMCGALVQGVLKKYTIITANWDAPSGEEWTVPLGAGISKTTAFNRRPMSLSMQYYHNLEHPTASASDQLRFQISFLYPSALPAKPVP
jgi:hypothetical protein